MKFKVFAVAALALTLISGNADKAEANDSQIFGAVIGAATGGFLGSNIGSGKGQLAATAAGTLIGAMLGSSMAQANDYPPNHATNYPVAYPEYRPQYRPQYQPVYVVQEPPRRVVVRKQTVIVKHVGPGYNKRAKAHRARENERNRRRLAQECYDHPRRCAKAF